ncbi:PASTA domain-containing protein [Leptotrichia shahii]|uniref:PASTA domain-containing protein n=1 Tax=Leptotrichia shahii TaxID=157691 RepID=A0A510JSY4_9FUSO|nr:PASTA domain-containing protein [Leptotrichia shahii]BBM41561.1 PASTA domain-containing protein [Leptotrichia shahii]
MATEYKFNYGKFFKSIIVLICLVVLVIFGRRVFERHFFNTRLTVIPDVTGLDKKEAIKYLKEAGLKVKVINSKTEKVPLDTVHNQDPRPGKEVKVNRVVRIWVNNGEDVKVPNIIGLELLEARSRLKGQNIQIETIDYYPSNQKYNTILGVYPKPGTKLEINQKISILVSSQQMIDPSVMPNITGLDLNDARELLKQIGLEIGSISQTNDPTLPINTIISTNPAAGTKIQRGQKVSVVINNGASIKKRARSNEEIINRSQQNINQKEIEKAIDDTMNKMDNNDSTNSQQDNKQQNNNPSDNSNSNGTSNEPSGDGGDDDN